MPRDPNQNAKAVVDFATGQRQPDPPAHVKNAAAVELGRMGGKIGGKARAAKITPKERAEWGRRAWRTRLAAAGGNGGDL